MNTEDEISTDCRARKIERILTDEFVECLTDNPICPHQVKCGDNRQFCFHPSRKKIVLQTPVKFSQFELVV